MSPDRLDTIIKGTQDYQPNSDVSLSILSRSLVEVIAPACEGKSTVMNKVVEMDTDFGYVRSWTTRNQEPRDEGSYYTFYNTATELESLFDRIDKREAVQYTAHPTTGKLYGTSPEGYPAEYNLLDTLASSVDDLDKLAFKSIYKVALVSKGSERRRRFLTRYPEESPERTKRLKEAALCLAWVLEQPEENLIWIENGKSDVEKAARDIRNAVKFSTPMPSLRNLAEDMLAKTDQLVA